MQRNDSNAIGAKEEAAASPRGSRPPLIRGSRLRADIDAASIAEDRNGRLFRTARGHMGFIGAGIPRCRLI